MKRLILTAAVILASAMTAFAQKYIVVDSEKMDALTMDGAGLLSRCILSNSDDFFRIYPGANVLSWGVGSGDEEESGSITKIIITPRWRWL